MIIFRLLAGSIVNGRGKYKLETTILLFRCEYLAVLVVTFKLSNLLVSINFTKILKLDKDVIDHLDCH